MSRLLTCPVPENINPLSPNGFMFSIARIPEVTYFCQEVSIPTVSLATVEQGSPFARIPLPGDTLDFGELNVQFLVDSQMQNYKALFNWIRGLGFPQNNEQYTQQVTNSYSMNENAASFSDATLTALNNKNSPAGTILFKDCVITSLNSITFTSTASDVQYIVGNASFRYTYFTFEETV